MDQATGTLHIQAIVNIWYRGMGMITRRISTRRFTALTWVSNFLINFSLQEGGGLKIPPLKMQLSPLISVYLICSNARLRHLSFGLRILFFGLREVWGKITVLAVRCDLARRRMIRLTAAVLLDWLPSASTTSCCQLYASQKGAFWDMRTEAFWWTCTCANNKRIVSISKHKSGDLVGSRRPSLAQRLLQAHAGPRSALAVSEARLGCTRHKWVMVWMPVTVVCSMFQRCHSLALC